MNNYRLIELLLNNEENGVIVEKHKGKCSTQVVMNTVFYNVKSPFVKSPHKFLKMLVVLRD